MILTTIWTGWLCLRRDTAALLMTFVLPPLLFLAFAAIFSRAPGHDNKLKLVVADLARTSATRRLIAALETAEALRVIPLEHGSASDVADLVARGTGDAGLIIRDDLTEKGSARPPLTIVESSERPLAASMTLGQVQNIVGKALPDVLLTRILDDLQNTGAIDADDRAFLDAAFAKQAADRSGKHLGFSRLATIEPALASRGNGSVLQYAAAVSAIFLLFGGVQGAYGLIDERDNGLADQIRLAAGGSSGALAGRMLFLVLQGTIQVALIYATAFLVYRAIVPLARLPACLAASVAAASACAGLALFACAMSRTRRQAELWTTFAVLLLSALGGSMVPRYLMPVWLQEASWWTPNAWIMQSLSQAVLPGQDPVRFASSLAVLAGLAVAGFVLALEAA